LSPKTLSDTILAAAILQCKLPLLQFFLAAPKIPFPQKVGLGWLHDAILTETVTGEYDCDKVCLSRDMNLD